MWSITEKGSGKTMKKITSAKKKTNTTQGHIIDTPPKNGAPRGMLQGKSITEKC